MRWIASLVVLCLMAASGVRPARAEVRDPPAGQLVAAKGLAASVTARRSSAVASELRLHAFVVEPAPALPAPPTASWFAAGAVTPRPDLVARPSCSARGPPVG
jgi:hypothetical protein